jgi:ABC-2 type transport system ATP-binding protein
MSGLLTPETLSVPPMIATASLSKQFDTTAAVQAVVLQVNRGEIYGLIGPNGAGKTTLIRMLAMVEEPSDGEIYIDGEKLLKGKANSGIKQKIGFLPDDFPLYNDLTVQAYLDYFARLYYLRDLTQRLNQVLALVELESKRHSLIGGLSRGMKQRLSLARTIIHRPALLLLDEPVSGLDPVARVQFRETLKLLCREGMTILISSHILSDLEDFCTSIGIMERGNLIESARLQALYRRERERRIIVTALAAPEQVLNYLQQRPWVSDCQQLPEPTQVQLTFAGDDPALADLLKSMVEANLQVIEFRPQQESLEDIFLKSGHRRTA